MSEHRCWLLVAISAGPVGPTPTCSFSWLLGLPHSMNGWVPKAGGRAESKRNRQKLFAFYYLVLESHNVTFTVCKPTRFKKKHVFYLFMVGRTVKFTCKNSMWGKNNHCSCLWKIPSATPTYLMGDLILYLHLVNGLRIFWSCLQARRLYLFY